MCATITHVDFGLLGNDSRFFTIASAREPGNFLPKDYVANEISLRTLLVGYK